MIKIYNFFLFAKYKMSVSQLLTPNRYDLFCKSITQSTPSTSGKLTTSNITNATSAVDTNASLSAAGGAAIAKALYVGESVTTSIMGTSTLAATGIIFANGGVRFLTTGGTQALLEYYETYTGALGSYNSTPVITVASVSMRIVRLGNLVMFNLPAGIGNQLNGAPSNITFNQQIPARFRPPVGVNDAVSFPVNIIENNVSKIGSMLIVPSTGDISFYAGGAPVASQGVPGINWAAATSGKAGVMDVNVSWQI